uniref:Uncharacterized protein n=1 Tax=Arundo donax TaxID=35708 RepID=A0A0A9AUJ5_ARUDO
MYKCNNNMLVAVWLCLTSSGS